MTSKKKELLPLMANDVFSVSRDCRSCAAARGTRYKVQKHMKLFPATGPLEFLAMDLLGPLPRTHQGNEYVLVITDRFTKLCRSVPLRNTKAVAIATVFLDLWVYAYGAPSYVLTDNGPQFAAKFFEAVCAMIGIKHVFTTAYHPQTNGQVERFNKTLAARLRHYVAEHQKDWDEFVQPLTYAYNMQVHRSTGTTPFDLVLSRHPKGILTESVGQLPEGTANAGSPAAVKRNTLNRLRYALSRAKVKLTKAQLRYKLDFDRRVRTLVRVEPGQMVLVDKPADYEGKHQDPMEEDRTIKKLSYRTTGPYKVLKANESTVTVEQDGLQVAVSIDRVTVDPVNGSGGYLNGEEHSNPVGDNPPGDPSQESPDPEYVVERIVDHEGTGDALQYCVRWYGYDAKDHTWEKASRIPPNFTKRYWNQVEKRVSV